MHTDDGLSTFLRLRPRLVGIAHRMLGTAADAEDVLQDVWMRWQTTDRTAIRNAAAFLTTTTTRLAINVMQSAHARREVSVGAWLPEPIAAGAHPGSDMEQREAIESGLLVLLAHLSRKERLAYILREAFDYPYRDIASVLRLGEANARQVVTRARRHVVLPPASRPGHTQAELQERTIPMKLVIIGGTGLIGSRLVRKLREQKHAALAPRQTPASTRSPVKGSRKCSTARQLSSGRRA